MNQKVEAEIVELRRLIELEREEERQMYLDVIQKLPLRERVAKGYCWYGLQVLKKGFGIGGRPYVLLERNGQEEHRFRSGMSVDLFTEQADVHRPRHSGVIKYVKRQRMMVILGGSDLPDWLNGGLLGIDLMFDERSYREMDRALEALLKADDNRLAELRHILMGQQKPVFKRSLSTSAGGSTTRLPIIPPYSNEASPDRPQQLPPAGFALNQVQQEALHDILAAEDLAIVHGPPGTGKTTTLVAAIAALIQREDRLLVATPSNTAADLICVRLDRIGIAPLRIGNISRVEDEVMQHTLEVKLADHPDTDQIKQLRREAADLRHKAKKSRRGPGSGREKGMLFREAGRLSAWAKQLEQRLLDYTLASARVVVTTLVGAANPVLSGYDFQTCIIDEAAQALEPACWIPIAKCQKVVLAGDPYQLPPTVKSREAEREGLGTTLLEKCIARHPKATRLLEIQYRMNEPIMGFSNWKFYDNRLKAHQSVARHTLPQFELSEAVTFIDTAGTGFEEKINPRFQSRYNENELHILFEHLTQLIGSTPPEHPLPLTAIISPYREQVVRCREMLDDDERLSKLSLTVDTIDGFQGQERELVYLSLVRSNDKGEIGFLKDYRRINVALTRAQKQLVVVGDSATIGADPFFSDFLTYVDRKGRYESAFVYMR